jgi:AraC-like DNA-binding protein
VRTNTRRLEGLCDGCPDAGKAPQAQIRVKTDGVSEGIERLDVQLIAQSFARHRHDTYAIGITLSGVQTFFYRGETRQCFPGQCHVLHPDEVHDGRAGTARGFRYRIAYVDPALIQEALGGSSLPFVRDAVIDGGRIPNELGCALWDPNEPLDSIKRIEAVSLLSLTLAKWSGTENKGKPLRLQSLLRVRDLIAADPRLMHSAAELERASGLNRWEMARQFRSAFGTSPSAFRTMRQLDEVRRLISAGFALADAAAHAGFSDQSHMSRMFKRTYGLTPRTWQASLA